MKKIFLILLLMIAIGLVGCASAPVKLQPVGEVNFSKYKTLTLTFSVADGVKMADDDLTEIKKYVIEAINEYCPKFQIIDDSRDNADLVLEIRFTKFVTVKAIQFDPPKIEAEISGKSSEGLIFTGIVKASGVSTLYRGDVGYWDGARFLFGGGIFGPNTWFKKIFAKKLAKSLPF